MNRPLSEKELAECAENLWDDELDPYHDSDDSRDMDYEPSSDWTAGHTNKDSSTENNDGAEETERENCDSDPESINNTAPEYAENNDGPEETESETGSIDNTAPFLYNQCPVWNLYGTEI